MHPPHKSGGCFLLIVFRQKNEKNMKNKMLGGLGRNKIKSFPKVAIGNPHRLGTTIRRGSPIETLGDDGILELRDDSMLDV